MKRYGLWVEEVPTNATGVKVAGTGDDDSTVVVKKKPKIFFFVWIFSINKIIYT